MSRSEYSDDCDGWALIRWRGAVAAATRGARGQAMLRELLAALDAMPRRELVRDVLRTPGGEVCALGALGVARGMDLEPIDPDNRAAVAKAFGVAEALVAEIMYENDDDFLAWERLEFEICGPMRPHERHKRAEMIEARGSDAARWRRMREWVARQIREEA